MADQLPQYPIIPQDTQPPLPSLPSISTHPPPNPHQPPIYINLPKPGRRMSQIGNKSLSPLSPKAQQDFNQFLLPHLRFLFEDPKFLAKEPQLPRNTAITSFRIHPVKVRYRILLMKYSTSAIVIERPGMGKEGKEFMKIIKKKIEDSRMCRPGLYGGNLKQETFFEIFVEDKDAVWEVEEGHRLNRARWDEIRVYPVREEE
ncbi:hypothetical protein QBC38DRAFT_518305 [Podospora fimiseda]|uniref:Uncharacterized protein n=1 Tax=Podospora fimiseda TaxID=252190 RepID=A0AAN6YRK0_9PEZI|nr:hypothetical protein QBC38DRAFT_518305 [Podospora fimiseda]